MNLATGVTGLIESIIFLKMTTAKSLNRLNVVNVELQDTPTEKWWRKMRRTNNARNYVSNVEGSAL